MILPLQVGKSHDLRLVVGPVHVVYLKGLEVADDDPAGILVVGQIPGIAPGLLEGGQAGAVRLPGAFAKTDIPALLLNEDAGVPDEAVNEAGVVQFHGDLKIDILLRLRHAVDVPQQCQPEGLGLLLFIAPALPVGGKSPGGSAPVLIRHIQAPLLAISIDSIPHRRRHLNTAYTTKCKWGGVRA